MEDHKTVFGLRIGASGGEYISYNSIFNEQSINNYLIKIDSIKTSCDKIIMLLGNEDIINIKTLKADEVEGDKNTDLSTDMIDVQSKTSH